MSTTWGPSGPGHRQVADRLPKTARGPAPRAHHIASADRTRYAGALARPHSKCHRTSGPPAGTRRAERHRFPTTGSAPVWRPRCCPTAPVWRPSASPRTLWRPRCCPTPPVWRPPTRPRTLRRPRYCPAPPVWRPTPARLAALRRPRCGPASPRPRSESGVTRCASFSSPSRWLKANG